MDMSLISNSKMATLVQFLLVDILYAILAYG